MAVFLSWLLFLVLFVSSSVSFSGKRLNGIVTPPLGRLLFAGKESETEVSTLNNSSQLQIHLLSLQWTPEDDPRQFSKVVKDVWRWKDAVLGDGRDFFVPKPRTLKALQSFLRVHNVDECVVLSNCARFEILLSTSTNPVPDISQLLLHQMESYRKRPMQINLPLDWAGVVDQNAATRGHQVAPCDQVELMKHWTHIKGVRDITDHLCHVAAGMAPRPHRPDKEIVFQPFSSRDAHILLQLRRTLEIAQGATSLSVLLRYAIQAGKASRTQAKVPELEELRKYGTGNSKYCIQPPPEVSQGVKAVRE
jgi:hypothetical protein